MDDKDDQVRRGADHRNSARARSWGSNSRHLPKRLKVLENENARLKKLLAEALTGMAIPRWRRETRIEWHYIVKKLPS
jgi:hypothetical protein